eukprot:12607777-Prorocentrum_lima.AAC.1
MPHNGVRVPHARTANEERGTQVYWPFASVVKMCCPPIHARELHPCVGVRFVRFGRETCDMLNVLHPQLLRAERAQQYPFSFELAHCPHPQFGGEEV